MLSCIFQCLFSSETTDRSLIAHLSVYTPYISYLNLLIENIFHVKLPFMALVYGLKWSSMALQIPQTNLLPIWIHSMLFVRKGAEDQKIQWCYPQPQRMSQLIGIRFWFLKMVLSLIDLFNILRYSCSSWCKCVIWSFLVLQTILYFPDPIEVKQDQIIEGSVKVSQSEENPRFLNIQLDCT